MAAKKLVRNTVECTIQIGKDEPFIETASVLAENTELGREFAKGFAAQGFMEQYDGSNEAYGVPARVLKARITKAVFETTDCWQGK